MNVRYRWRIGVEARALILVTAILLAFGLATVYSASSVELIQKGRSGAQFFLKQLGGAAVGIVLFAIVAKVDAARWERWAWPLMILSLVLCTILVLPFTQSIVTEINGSRRFLRGGSLQPSELGKLAVIVWTSMLLVKKGDAMRRLTKGLVPFLVVIGFLAYLVVLQPDLSQALMYLFIMGIILFAGGVRIGHFVALGVIATPLLYQKIQNLQYVLLRMSMFFAPGSVPTQEFQQKQSLIAVGSGQMFGVGFGQGRQGMFLPYGYDDFIAAIIGEEWGFVGLTFIIIAFAAYCALAFRIALKARTKFLQLVAIGIAITITVTAYVHIGVSIGLLPNTGLTLPFISYGRTNLILSLVMTGILVNIGSERERVIGDRATDPSAVSTVPRDVAGQAA